MRFKKYYIVDKDGAILQEVASNSCDPVLSWRDMMAEDLGVSPESLEVMPVGEYEVE